MTAQQIPVLGFEKIKLSKNEYTKLKLGIQSEVSNLMTNCILS